ncbi:MAG: TorF family putative porin [Oleispira sp.]
MTKLSQAIALATAMTAGLVGTTTTQAEVSASAGVASSYLWRGQNLSNGAAVVSGSLDYGHESGAYAGAWVSSGDVALGTEYDLYVGFAGDAGDLSYDVGYIGYIYPSQSEEAVAAGNATSTADELGDVSDLYLNLSFAGVDFTTNFSDNGGDYVYNTLGYGMDSVSGLIGVSTDLEDDGKGAYTHIDLSYAYNDNVSFTVSKMVAQSSGTSAASPEFVVSYSLPIE